MDEKEFITVTHLKNILENLSPKDIVTNAYKEYVPSQRSGHTIIDIETGKVKSLGIELNEPPLQFMNYITLYSINFDEEPISEEEFFTENEYEEYLEFNDDPTDYTPDIVSEFCSLKGINEFDRKIDILSRNYKNTEMVNYNKWESRILELYYDEVQKFYDPLDESP